MEIANSPTQKPLMKQLRHKRIMLKYGYIKNRMKTVKNGQTRTRGTEEHKRSQRFKAKARKRKYADVIEQLITQRVAEVMAAYEANQNNQNGNGNPNVNVGGVVPDSALTWWNSHKRTTGTNAAYAMTWKALMKLMT
ncbi:hypothetical protein Tco_1333435 [Tanacetum coccineum]